MTCSHCTHPMYAAIRCSVCGRWTDEKEEMNRDDIIRMAREAGFEFPADYDLTEPISRLERFANLVAAAEREACAQLVENFYTSNPNMLAEAIRSRK